MFQRYQDRIELAAEDRAALEQVAGELEAGGAGLSDSEREWLLGLCDRYLDDLRLADEGSEIAGLDADILARVADPAEAGA